ncbi:hypothetical protein ACPSUS_004776, partial [Escherichia coli]
TMQREKTPEWREKQKGSRGIRRGQRYRLVFQFPIRERCFGRLKEYRRIATRYDKTARNYLAMVKLGCIRLFYQRLRN